MKKFRFIYFLIGLSMTYLLISCGGEDDDDGSEEQLQAIVVADKEMAEPGETIVLDGSTSTGGSFQYNWTFSGPGPVEVEGIMHDPSSGNIIAGTPTLAFTATVNGIYNFTLEIIQGNTFSTTGVAVEISGTVSLKELIEASEGTVELKDINYEDGVADYVVAEDLTLTQSIQINSGYSITIAFAEGAGLIIPSGTYFTNNGSNLILTAQNESWKGVLVESGGLNISNTQIEKAGGSTFKDYPEAAITVEAGSVTLTTNTFSDNEGFDLNLLTSSYQEITGNDFGSETPINLQTATLPYVQQNYFSGLEPLLTVNTDINVQIVAEGSQLNLYAPVNYYFKGTGPAFNSAVYFTPSINQTLYFDEGGAFLAFQGLVHSGSEEGVLSFEGKDGAAWKGIFLQGSSQLHHMTINHAGNGIIESNSLNIVDVPSALYCQGQVAGIKNLHIENSGGYGLYFGGFATVNTNNPETNYTEIYVSECQESFLSSPYNIVHTFLQGDFYFTNTSGSGSVEITGSSSSFPAAEIEWPELGDGNKYQVISSIQYSGVDLIISEGAHLQFGSGVSLTALQASSLTINGSATAPIILESNGSVWGGVVIGNGGSNTDATFDYVTIRQGNQYNLKLSTKGSVNFTNCTFSDSQGDGVYLDSFGNSFDFLDAAYNNTFSNNAGEDIVDQSL